MKRMQSLASKAALASALSFTALTLASARANAQFVVSYFNFNSLTNNSDVTVSSIPPDAGNGTLSTNFPAGSDVTSYSGTPINAQGADPGGQALVLFGGTGADAEGTGGSNGKYLQLQLNTTGSSGLNFSFATRRTNTGFTNGQLSYSLDGTNFTSVGTYNISSVFVAQAFDLSTISALNNRSAVYFRLTLNGATVSSGNNRIDNLKVTALTAPAPSSLLAALAGVPGVGLMIRRRKNAK